MGTSSLGWHERPALSLAREASSAGDRITAEGYFQHAEHYYRLMTGNGSDADQQEHRSAPIDQVPF